MFRIKHILICFKIKTYVLILFLILKYVFKIKRMFCLFNKT